VTFRSGIMTSNWTDWPKRS